MNIAWTWLEQVYWRWQTWMMGGGAHCGISIAGYTAIVNSQIAKPKAIQLQDSISFSLLAYSHIQYVPRDGISVRYVSIPARRPGAAWLVSRQDGHGNAVRKREVPAKDPKQGLPAHDSPGKALARLGAAHAPTGGGLFSSRRATAVRHARDRRCKGERLHGGARRVFLAG